jgi:hypothetical protein
MIQSAHFDAFLTSTAPVLREKSDFAKRSQSALKIKDLFAKFMLEGPKIPLKKAKFHAEKADFRRDEANSSSHPATHPRGCRAFSCGGILSLRTKQ